LKGLQLAAFFIILANMKVSLLFICLTISIRFFGQQINYNDLIGTSWTYNKQTFSDSISFVFTDSAHYKFYYWKNGKNYYNKNLMNYSLDTSYSPTLWCWGTFTEIGTGNQKDGQEMCCFLRMIDKNTLEAQSKWNGKKPKRGSWKKHAKVTYTMIKTS
jgi:hypothetical protein